MMKGFCPERACLDGVMYGGGFVRGVFVRRGFCPTFNLSISGHPSTSGLHQ